MQKRARDSTRLVAGKPTTTTPMFFFSISLPKALTARRKHDIRLVSSKKSRFVELLGWPLTNGDEGSYSGAHSDSPYLGGHIEHHGNDGRVIVAVDDEAHFSEPPAEVGGVLCQLLQTFAACAANVQSDELNYCTIHTNKLLLFSFNKFTLTFLSVHVGLSLRITAGYSESKPIMVDNIFFHKT